MSAIAKDNGVDGRAKSFGTALKRKEDPALLAGRGRYVDDLALPGMLHAAFVRCPHAHARIEGIDVEAARALPGVHAVLTFSDLPKNLQVRTLPVFVNNPAITQLYLPLTLAKDEVCFVGEAVAIVVAETRHIAEDAAALVDVSYDPLPAASDCRDAAAPDAPLAHLGATSNVAARGELNVGDTDRAFAEAAVVCKTSILQHRGGAFSIECRAVVANYDAVTESVTMYVASQGSHRIKRAMVELFDFADHQIRVVTPDVGGGFGPKALIYPEYAAVTVAAMRLNRPVKWFEDRRENFLTTSQERDQYWDMEIAVDKDAHILGVRGRMIHDCGAYIPAGSGLVVPWIAASTVPGPYIVPNYRLEYLGVMTNKVQTSSVRGAGRPQAVLTMERLMDRVAAAMDLDRAEVRRRNFIQPEQMPYKVGILFRDNRPVVYDSGDYPKCLELVLQKAGYADFRARQETARRAGTYLGIGVSSAVEATGLGPYEAATVRVSTSGKITIYTGATPQGQAHKTTLAQIAADELGVSPDDVTIVTGDTATIGQGIGTSAARTAVNAGNAVHLASKQLGEKARALASEICAVPAEELELVGGYIQLRRLSPGAAERQNVPRIALKDVAKRSAGTPGFAMTGAADPGLETTAFFKPNQSTYSNGAQVAEVAVDIETGQVKILRLTVVHDCGRAINPLVVEGQVIGGIAHGIGNALFERMLYDGNAQPVSVNFGDYILPAAPDMPSVIEIFHNETPSPLNPLGVKGAGEGGTIASVAAIISAVEDALTPFGVKINEAPIMPERIVELLGESARGRTQ